MFSICQIFIRDCLMEFSARENTVQLDSYKTGFNLEAEYLHYVNAKEAIIIGVRKKGPTGQVLSESLFIRNAWPRPCLFLKEVHEMFTLNVKQRQRGKNTSQPSSQCIELLET